MGYLFNHKRAPQTKFGTKYSRFFRSFLKICVLFQAFKDLYPPKKQKNMRKFEK